MKVILTERLDLRKPGTYTSVELSKANFFKILVKATENDVLADHVAYVTTLDHLKNEFDLTFTINREAPVINQGDLVLLAVLDLPAKKEEAFKFLYRKITLTK